MRRSEPSVHALDCLGECILTLLFRCHTECIFTQLLSGGSGIHMDNRNHFSIALTAHMQWSISAMDHGRETLAVDAPRPLCP